MPFITQEKTNFKYILIMVILAAIVGGGILGYYYWWIKELETKIVELELRLPPRVIEDETADWKTYRNEEYGFEIKYPKDFEVKVGEDCLFKNFYGPCILSLGRLPEKPIGVLKEGVDIYTGETEEDLQYCLKGYKLPLSEVTEIEINDTIFKKQRGILDSAMGGKRTHGDIYNVIYNNTCYTITSKFHFSSVEFAAGAGAFGEPRAATPEEIEQEREEINAALDEFEKIIKTLILF